MLYRDLLTKREAIKSDPASAKEYQDWLASPMTKLVIGILTVEGQPRQPDAINGDTACYQHGDSVGWARCLNRMQMLDRREADEVPATFDQEHESASERD